MDSIVVQISMIILCRLWKSLKLIDHLAIKVVTRSIAGCCGCEEHPCTRKGVPKLRVHVAVASCCHSGEPIVEAPSHFRRSLYRSMSQPRGAVAYVVGRRGSALRALVAQGLVLGEVWSLFLTLRLHELPLINAECWTY